MSAELALRSVIVPCTDLDAALALYSEALGLPVKFRDGDRYAALDAGGGLTLALATPDEHPADGHVVLAVKTPDLPAAMARLTSAGLEVVEEPREGGHETRALLRDAAGTHLSIYTPRP